jgi:hypothetical protein
MDLNFALLLPLDMLGSNFAMNLFSEKGIKVYIINPSPRFLHDGIYKYVGTTAWYVYIKGMNTEIKIEYARYRK